ncbi:hypothetical protein FK220_012560 [Flavobacteriaceae bacterium TP-CH-4]|uniref:Uncharacterized protein n=1 Tax=Pelagihabitans pacificus TaxID=2696054 RepID=A0A967ATN1_9FLAO|nr:hypothetical protein [Pelagihabitans pacificus]NHF60179.1 hypothetical protein [Pelagihabitans pacificus]
MSLRGKTVRILVSEPFEWSHGNLFGTIEDDRGGKSLKVRLTKEIEGKKLTSDLMALKPRYKEETFKPLLQNYSVAVVVALIAEDTENFDYTIIGSVTVD